MTLSKQPILLMLTLGFWAMTLSTSHAAEGGLRGDLVEKVRFSPADYESLKNADAYEKFMAVLQMPATLSPDTLNQIDFSVRKVAFYHVSDRNHKKFSRDFYESLEQRMIDKFIQVKRFSVHECFECKTTKVLLKEKQFSVLRQLDSNESFAKVGEKIDVDSFVLWDAFMHKNEPVLNIRIVSSENGQVRWSKQYEGEHDTEHDWEFYTSFWDLEATRENTVGGKDITVSPLVAIGVRALARSTISHRLFYGYGAEFFFNTTGRANIAVHGFTLNGRVALEFDSLIGNEEKNYGNWLAYASLGQAFIKTVPTVQFRTGVEVRLNKSNFIDIGVVSLVKREFEVESQSGFANTATLGGAGYDITIGLRF